MVRPRRDGDQRLSGPEPGRCMGESMALAPGPCHGQASRPEADVRRGRAARQASPSPVAATSARSRRSAAARSEGDRPGSRSSPRSAAPSTGGASSRRTRRVWRGRVDAVGDPRLERRVPGAEDPASEHHDGVAAGQVETPDHGAGHGRELVGEPVEDPLGDRVAVVRRRRRRSGRGRTGRSPGGVRTRWRRSRRWAGACRRTRAPTAPAPSLGRGRRGRGRPPRAPPCRSRRRRPSRPRSGRGRRAGPAAHRGRSPPR